ncbi:tetratricopeptide repeat protein [Streptomyces sp. Go-475]|uniref:tetratricopeptide repeat protein n=1 Tax=Streptomyces sp. Go-475 TaxID=2072505 RepID=UPI000DEF4A37|nr:tetratricopeptide repeat protein [Streptomyces sp. Go-475]AXE88037.1 tetratricopeptide repeat protein [Streptomyces sp. Go-475]
MLWGKRWERSVAAGRDVWLAVTGDHNRLFFTRQVRSAYWEQVRRIAPAELLGRERELAELTAFCTADSGPAYAWWRAEAWAGKTALLSWFALNPPPGVRIVPFFVTARLGAQNDVAAYVDVVLEQLAELAGEDLPALLTKATREAHLLHLYRAAARARAERGERLVLLLDSLDEDRGVTTGPEAHSIAGLLPALPESGLRVLVAGRRNPVLPVDVPDDHPLRDPAILRTLAPSPYARTIRAEAERELKRLIEAGGLEYDLLALVTAANGGLTAEDLSALTGAVPYRVRDVLRTRAGRTFDVRLNVYLLAHEELQRRALDMLGTAELDRHRARLHAWADTWRDRGWPDGTPHYLLSGYFGLLREARDLRRAVDCAVDAVRHDRMLDVTGGDAAALAEIRNAEEMAAEAGVPHLTDLVRLSLRREELERRNDSVTRTFPWAWATLGRVRRAEALARSIPGLDWRAMALADVAAVVLDAGDRAEALRLLEEAEQAAERYRFDVDDFDEERDLVLAEVSRGWAKAGLFDRAEHLLTSIAGIDIREDLLLDLVRSLVAAGAFDRAEDLCRRQEDEHVRGLGLAAAAAALTETGHLDRAEALARSEDHAVRPLVLARIAGVLRRTGREREAEALLTAVEAAVTSPDLLTEVVEALADAGAYDRAETAALLHDTAAERGWALRGVVRALAATGDGARAGALAERIEHPPARSGAVPAIVEGLAEAGAHEEAERLARDLTDEEARDTAVRAVVDALIRAGETDRAERLAGEDTATEPGEVALCSVIEGRARAGELDRAFAMARSLGSREGHEALVRGAVASSRAADEVAETVARAEAGIRRCGRGGSLHPADTAIMLAEAGFDGAARTVLDQVGVPAPGDPDGISLHEQMWAAQIARALAYAGRFDAAEELVRGLGNRPGGAFALTPLIKRLCAAGEFDRALAFAAGLTDRMRDHARGEIAIALADAGATARAASLAREVTAGSLRVRCWARIAVSLAAAGDRRAAEDALTEAVSHDAREPWAIPDLLRACFALGRADEGERLLARLDDDVPGFHTAVVRALVEAGQYERARELFGGPGREWHQAVLVRVVVEAGQLARAEELARALGTTDARHGDAPSSALVRAWVALAPVVEPARGRALVARALRHETLQEVLPAIVRLEPEAVPLIVDLLGRSTHHDRPTAARTSAPS